jgi:hypothetical protein
LTDADDQIAPEKRRTAGGERNRKQRVDPDDWRQIREAEGEISPQAHRPFESRPITKLVQLVVVAA